MNKTIVLALFLVIALLAFSLTVNGAPIGEEMLDDAGAERNDKVHKIAAAFDDINAAQGGEL